MIGKYCYQISKLYVKRMLNYISLKYKIECMYISPLSTNPIKHKAPKNQMKQT